VASIMAMGVHEMKSTNFKPRFLVEGEDVIMVLIVYGCNGILELTDRCSQTMQQR